MKKMVYVGASEKYLKRNYEYYVKEHSGFDNYYLVNQYENDLYMGLGYIIPKSDFTIPNNGVYNLDVTGQLQVDSMPIILKGSIDKKWKLPTIELVKFDKKKGRTVVKFKGIRKAVVAKCNPKEKFNEYEGLVTCLLKQSSGMSNQELKRYLEHADKKTIK